MVGENHILFVGDDVLILTVEDDKISFLIINNLLRSEWGGVVKGENKFLICEGNCVEIIWGFVVQSAKHGEALCSVCIPISQLIREVEENKIIVMVLVVVGVVIVVMVLVIRLVVLVVMLVIRWWIMARWS